MPVADVIERIKRRFRLLTPASGVGDLTNILAAAWDLYYDTDLWAGTIPAEKRVDTLNELVLKCVEIMEFEERTKAVHDPEI
jgi:hypothetical protein